MSVSKPISPLQAAKHLCEFSGWSLTNLKLQKIAYIAQMLHIGETGGRRLIDGEFEAWDYGPVSTPIYREVRGFGADAIQNVFRRFPPASNDAQEFLREIYDNLAGWTPGQLVAFTHRNDGAWARHYIPGGKGVMIPDQSILDEYRRFHEQKTAA